MYFIKEKEQTLPRFPALCLEEVNLSGLSSAVWYVLAESRLWAVGFETHIILKKIKIKIKTVTATTPSLNFIWTVSRSPS